MANYNINEVLSIANGEIGYLEKQSNSQLDDKTANAGDKNYTKYARDYNTWTGNNLQGQAWCAMFCSWCFAKAYGTSAAREILCGNLYAYCPYIVSAFKAKGQWYTSPAVGDLILFKDSTGVACHVGLVVGVGNGLVTTIEGNTSSVSGVVANGGCVRKKSYSTGYNRIMGYARPKYNTTTTATSSSYTYTDFVKDVQKVIGAKVDGCAGSETLSKTITLSKSKNSRHAVVKAVQNYLMAIGYSLPKYGADGSFGAEMHTAVVQYQKNNGCTADGEITAGQRTWKKLLKLA